MKQTFLMCPPNKYWRPDGNEYAWGATDASPRAALLEWIEVARAYDALGIQVVVAPAAPPHAFDAVYTADWGMFVPDYGFLFSNMAATHRKPEMMFTERFLREELSLPMHGRMEYEWEGSSCVRISPGGTFVMASYGVRCKPKTCHEIAHLLGMPLVAVKVRGDDSIHLDTAIAVFDRQPLVLVCWSGFDQPKGEWDPTIAWREIKRRCHDEGTAFEFLRDRDARGYGTNVRTADCATVVAPSGLSEDYWEILTRYDYKRRELDLPNLFLKGGGAGACLSLDLTAAVAAGWIPPDQWLLESRLHAVIQMVPDYPTTVIELPAAM